MKSSFLTAPARRLSLGLAAAALLLVAGAPAVASAQSQTCRMETHTTTTIPAGTGCEIIRHEARWSGAPSGAQVAVSADELVCGKTRIDRWSVAQRAAQSACDRAVDGSGFKISENLSLVSRHDYLVTVRQISAGDVGGSTGPYVTTELSTWDFTTGTRVTLADVLPYDHAQITALAERRFHELPTSADYRFDPGAFMLTEIDGAQVVVFSFPGVSGDARGTTLDMPLYLPIGITPRGITPTPGDDSARTARSPIRERVRAAACTRVGHIVC